MFYYEFQFDTEMFFKVFLFQLVQLAIMVSYVFSPVGIAMLVHVTTQLDNVWKAVLRAGKE